MMKEKISKENIVSLYMNYRVRVGKKDITVDEFLKHTDLSKKTFANYFSNKNDIEKHIYKVFIEQTISLLNDSEDYINFDTKNKLISFYYTFFELLTANREYVLLSIKKLGISELKLLSRLKKMFIKYIVTLNIDSFDLKNSTLNKTKSNITQEVAWLQLLAVLKFWVDDVSPSLEKTDIFIEKSINTSFDLINTKPLESLIDLGKFLFNEKIKNNL